jgi:hypothetical protein
LRFKQNTKIICEGKEICAIATPPYNKV